MRLKLILPNSLRRVAIMAGVGILALALSGNAGQASYKFKVAFTQQQLFNDCGIGHHGGDSGHYWCETGGGSVDCYKSKAGKTSCYKTEALALDPKVKLFAKPADVAPLGGGPDVNTDGGTKLHQQKQHAGDAITVGPSLGISVSQ
jgi:hypothetical protein